MTLRRRVDALEAALSPTQLVLRWLAEAHAFGSLEAYVTSLLDLPGDQQPIDRLCRDACAGVRASLRGKRSEVVDAAVRNALRETVFRYELVLRIYVAAHELLDRETLLEALFASQLALLVRDERTQRVADESHLERLRQCRDLTALQVRELLAAKEARVAVEARYLQGQDALFPDVANAFDDQIRRSQRLAEMAADMSELDGVEPTPPVDPDAIALRVDQLVADLVEPARSTALEKLGEGRPAFDIANAWLRNKFAVATTPDTQTATLQREGNGP
jgi:hypothetical protein